ncbi:unnamed protein product [Oikopleura dioica]|uniref:T-complex-associated testis-expressed protein 1 n=1 Tax=Oikopleura dioica TaxID=34765 RepID=E4XNB6_OIKDI|nr:unnamed protein product [Oikopleura dioica]
MAAVMTRRIIAEDDEWTLQTVPFLRQMALKTIVANWNDFPHFAELPGEKERSVLVEKLALDVPLEKAVLIDDNTYWKRRADTKWPVYDIARYSGSYKRMFLEKTLEETIEHFVPNRSDSDELRRIVNLAKSEVVKLNIEQILPPIPDIKEINEEDDDDDDSPSHLDLTPVVAELKKLEEFSIQFGVKNVGMNFEWGFFTLTQYDALMISSTMRACPQLQVLRLTESRLDDGNARLIVKSLLKHPNLRVLDLRRNHLRCSAARAIAKLVSTVNTWSDWKCAFERSHETQKLNLTQNFINDIGGELICDALESNSTLTHLHIAANNLGEGFGKALSSLLAKNETLEEVLLASCNIGEESGKNIQHAMRSNTTLTSFDLRLTGITPDSEHAILLKVEENQSN